MRRVNVVIERGPTGQYRAWFPGLPDVSGLGSSRAEALGHLILVHGYRAGVVFDVQSITAAGAPLE